MLTVTPPVRPARRASPAARRSLAVLAAGAISLFAAGSALATTPEGTVTVDTDGCDFTVTIDLAQAWPEVLSYRDLETRTAERLGTTATRTLDSSGGWSRIRSRSTTGTIRSRGRPGRRT